MDTMKLIEIVDTTDDENHSLALVPAETLIKFAEMIVLECIKVARQQRDPANLNYKPSERFVEDLQRHFGIDS